MDFDFGAPQGGHKGRDDPSKQDLDTGGLPSRVNSDEPREPNTKQQKTGTEGAKQNKKDKKDKFVLCNHEGCTEPQQRKGERKCIEHRTRLTVESSSIGNYIEI